MFMMSMMSVMSVMKLMRWFLIGAFFLLSSGWAAAQQESPQTPRAMPPPVAPAGLPPLPAATGQSAGSSLNLPSLKAVLLVGPIDGDTGAWTTAEKANMELAASELEANGVTVYRFYAPNNDWNAIKAAANGAHFLFYRGHGVSWGSTTPLTVGGFYLKDTFVSSNTIRSDLKLAPNAIVMLYGCYTAGSDGADPNPISSAEAQRRVAQYSDPFFDNGAGGYYANWFGDAYQMYVRYLFQGQTLGQAYESYFDFNAASVERYTYPGLPGVAMWLDKDVWGVTMYNNAFAGQADARLTDLFVAPAMTLSTSAVTRLAEPTDAPQTITLTVDGTTSDAFTWTASLEPTGASWIRIAPSSGADGQSLGVTLTPKGLPLGTYHVNLRVSTNTPGIGNGSQTASVTLRVVAEVHSVFLPAVQKATP